MAAGDLITGPGQIQWRNLLLGEGTDFDLTKLAGILDMPPVDIGSKHRPRSHGGDPGVVLAQPQAVTATFDIDPLAGGGTAAARSLLMAQTGMPEDSRQEPIAICLDAGQTWLRYGQLTARNIPVQMLYETLVKDAVLQWQCADPRLYSSVLNTAVLKLPQAAPSTQTIRTNFAATPRPLLPTSVGWGYQQGTGESATISTLSTAGPNGINGFQRATINTAKTSGASGHSLQDTSPSGGAGDVITGSCYVRSTAAVQVQAVVSCIVAASSTVVGTATGPLVTLTPNTWTRISATPTATGTYGQVKIYATTTGVVPAGGTLDTAQMLIEKSAVLGAYFDGSTVPGTANTVDAWAGAANNSTSTETVSSDGVYPLVYPFNYAPVAAGGGPQSVVNNGNVATPPVLTFTGPLTSPSITITDINGTRKTTFNLVLSATDSLVVDVLNRSVTLGGASRYGFTSGTPIESLTIAPGTSTIMLDGTGNSASQLTVACSDAYI